MKDNIDLQSDEFDALVALIRTFKNLPAIVDDDYPEMRQYYESRLDSFLKACEANGRIKPKPTVGDKALTFDALRQANRERLPLFKNKHGRLAHTKSKGSDWSPAQWLQAVVGELGEYANLRKKYERGDLDVVEFTVLAAKELADVLVYLDILAFQLNINLERATRMKFNEVSDRVGCEVKL